MSTANVSSNYKFNLPSLTDAADITELSKNWEQLDTELKKMQDDTDTELESVRTDLDTATEKLKGIEEGANAYSLPTASDSILGGVKTTSTVKSAEGHTPCPIVDGVPYYQDTTYNDVSTSKSGLMTASDKTKLNGIAEGAEVNQNAFSNIKVGSITISADGKTDTLTLTAGTNVTLTPSATNGTVTISVPNKYTYGTEDLTAGTSELATGKLYFVYE